MTHIRRWTRGTMLLAGAAALLLSGCKVNDVLNPSVVDAATFDPNNDAPMISFSAQTQLWAAVNNVTTYGGYFAEEHINGAARVEPSDIGRRAVTPANADLNTNMWEPVSRAIAANANVISALSGGSGAASDINIARAQMNLGFAMALMGETFCEGVIQTGPAQAPAQMQDSAIAHFNKAITVASAATGAETAIIVSASKIGIARAQLQKGDNATASAAAATALAGAASGFSYNVITVDDAGQSRPANLVRNNQVYMYSYPAKLSTVSALYRALNDPRAGSVAAGVSQDGATPAYQQTKYTSTTAPIRIASYLEAQYVQAEAALKGGGGQTAALTLIAARRAANGQGTFVSIDNTAILTELLKQASLDFWFEAKKLGDYRRNLTVEPLISAPGAPYKGALVFGNNTCLPIPQAELNANPNLY